MAWDKKIPKDAGAAFSDDGIVDPSLESDLGAEYEVFEAGKVAEEESKSELELARQEAAENLDMAQRKQAEFDNYRKRMRTEQSDAVTRAGQRIIEELLPALDNLERAVEHASAAGETSELLKGVEMVHQQVLDVFAKEGVGVQDPQGEMFDPELHQAVGQGEAPELPEGTVLEVYQKGYVMHGRVVRPAQVVVSTGGPVTQTD